MSVQEGHYDAFRKNGAPTWYKDTHTAWQADLVESGLIFAFCILAVAAFVILPGIRGKDRIFTFIRITLSLYVGGVILLTNFAYTWETAETHTRTKYKAGIGKDIQADIGVHIGFRGINITLKGTPEHQLNETINYNEHFSWEWQQGRLGFGPFAGRINQEYRAAQFRGLPLPILWVAEYFTIDGEGLRWGRLYRLSGFYGHALLWLAFPLWFLTNILFFVLLRYAAYFLCMTGTSMIVANIIWMTLRNSIELKIPFSAEHILEFHYGGAFWVCLGTGIFCFLVGLIILVMDLRVPETIATFFGVDVLQDVDDIVKENSTLSNTSIIKISRANTFFRVTNERKGESSSNKVHPASPPPSYKTEESESSESELEPTDTEEEDDGEPNQNQQTITRGRASFVRQMSRGFINRFQRPRRRPSTSALSNQQGTPTRTQYRRNPNFNKLANANRINGSNASLSSTVTNSQTSSKRRVAITLPNEVV